MNCPEGEMFVCKKMYGGGMGDQIRRYCEEVKANVMTFLYYNNKTIYLLYIYIISKLPNNLFIILFYVFIPLGL